MAAAAIPVIEVIGPELAVLAPEVGEVIATTATEALPIIEETMTTKGAQIADLLGRLTKSLGSKATKLLETGPDHLNNTIALLQNVQAFTNTANNINKQHDLNFPRSGGAIKKRKAKRSKEAFRALKANGLNDSIVEDVLNKLFTEVVGRDYKKRQVEYYKKLVALFRKVKSDVEIPAVTESNIQEVSKKINAIIKTITTNVKDPKKGDIVKKFTDSFIDGFSDAFSFDPTTKTAPTAEKLRTIGSYISAIPMWLMAPTFTQ